jgi:Cu/Ag efflux protein CusF
MKRFEIKTLILTMIVLCIVFVPAVSAQENSMVNNKPSDLQQELINALNSKAKSSSIDNVVANYCTVNKDKILKNGFGSNNKTYQLKDGSKIAFIKNGIFIDSLTIEANNKTTQPVSKENNIVSASLVNPAYTSTIKYGVTRYNYLGWALFTVYTQGYFGYDYTNVAPHFVNGWYTKYLAFNPWTVSNWAAGGDMYGSKTAEVYSKGNFHFGVVIEGNQIDIQDIYLKPYIRCNQYGSYWTGYDS